MSNYEVCQELPAHCIAMRYGSRQSLPVPVCTSAVAHCVFMQIVALYHRTVPRVINEILF